MSPIFVNYRSSTTAIDDVSLLRIHQSPSNVTYLVDLPKLGDVAFSTPGKDGKTLADLLQTKDTPKVFFDCRGACHALFKHFGVKVSGVLDMQLMEWANRVRHPEIKGEKHVPRLKSFVYSVNLIPKDEAARKAWGELRDSLTYKFEPNKGALAVSLDDRNQHAQVAQYESQLKVFLDGKLSAPQVEMAQNTSGERVRFALSTYEGTIRKLNVEHIADYMSRSPVPGSGQQMSFRVYRHMLSKQTKAKHARGAGLKKRPGCFRVRLPAVSQEVELKKDPPQPL